MEILSLKHVREFYCDVRICILFIKRSIPLGFSLSRLSWDFKSLTSFNPFHEMVLYSIEVKYCSAVEVSVTQMDNLVTLLNPCLCGPPPRVFLNCYGLFYSCKNCVLYLRNLISQITTTFWNYITVTLRKIVIQAFSPFYWETLFA